MSELSIRTTLMDDSGEGFSSTRCSTSLFLQFHSEKVLNVLRRVESLANGGSVCTAANSGAALRPSSVLPAGGVQLSPEDFTKAQRFCKYAGSALQYEDVGTAIQNLQKALKLLTTGKE